MMIMRPPQQGHGVASTDCGRVIGGSLVLGIGGGARGDCQKLARLRDVLGARAAGEQAVVADAVEALRQHVEQEAADELVRRRASWSCSGLAPRSGSP